MRAKRAFLKFNKLKIKKLQTFNYFKKSHRTYQPKNVNNFYLIAANPYKIEEPFFLNFLKNLKITKKVSFLTKSISLNLKKTSKPNGIRMGKGKGKVKHKFSLVQKNLSLINLREINNNNLLTIFKKLKGKVSSRLKFKYSKDNF